MWRLQVTLLRAASFAALAFGVTALRWLTRKKDGEEGQSPHSSPQAQPKEVPSPPIAHKQLSPFKRASMEYAQRGPQEGGRVAEPGGSTERNSSTGARSVEKNLRFLEPTSSIGEESIQYRGSSAGPSESDSDYSDAESSSGVDTPADGHASIQTPHSYKSHTTDGSLCIVSKHNSPHMDYEAEKSPFDLSSPRNRHQSSQEEISPEGGASRNSHAQEQGRHSRHPSFPVIDYEPEHKGFYANSQALAGSFEMAPAPTEEGDALANVDEALADLEEAGEQGPRRHSRSFSEPNLVAHALQQQAYQQAAPLEASRHQESSEEDEESLAANRQPPTGAGTVAGSSSVAGVSSSNGDQASSSAGQSSSKRSREEPEAPPLLRLDVLSGPCGGRDFTIDDPTTQVSIGRGADNTLAVEDNEVSGRHAVVLWDAATRNWQARDMGSLNGTRLNGNFINNSVRRPGKPHRLNTDDILLLGSRTAIKVIYLPNARMPDVPRNLKRVAAPPSLLHPTTTLRSEAMASLRAEVGIEKAFQAETLRLDGAVLCRIGVEHQRQGMPCEDVPFWGEPGRYHAALYCVFDGHCGRKTSSMCTRLLPEELRKRMPEVRPLLDTAEGVGHIWEEVFLAVDAALDTEDGSTATAVLVWKDAHANLCIQTANVGDSAAVFCKSDADPREGYLKLTKDHRISDPDEKKRLADLGIELGKNRTRLYGLNLSRCLGDKYIKGADLGFTAVPHVSSVARLAPHEAGMLVVASDGLWDVADPGRVMEVMFEAQKHPNANPEVVAEAIYQHAMKQRTRDDVCLFVLTFSPETNLAASSPKTGFL